ncbi:hypothetical protein [Anaerosolibacter sp.]|uniref:hypothetical protein n=1 Tax=Anaerosolibacter sp. TaxID=1872527 RepID=UPI0039EF69A9
MKSYWQELPYKIKPVISQLGGGVNNGLPPFELQENEATEQKNCSSKKYPIHTVRPPRSDYSTDLSGVIRHMGTRSDEYITVVDGTAWKYWNGSVWVDILTGLTAANAKTIDFMGKTILVNGTDEKYWDGSTTGNVAGMPNSNFLAVHANRLYAASRDSQTLSFSALRIYNDWTTVDDAGSIVAETRDGEGCSGLTAFANHVVLFKEHSMHELYGTGPRNYQFNTTSDQIGCISDRTIKEVKGRLFWLGYEGVYMYSGGVAPTLISFPLQGYIDRLDIANKLKACAGTDEERYYISIPIDSGSKILCVYDTRFGKWYVEDDIKIVEFTEFQNVLYGIAEDGQVKKMIDAAGGETIEWYWISKSFNEGSLSQKKEWYRLYFIVNLPTGSTLNVGLSNSVSGDDFTTIKTFSSSSAVFNQQIEIPLTIAQKADWVRIKLSGTGPCDIHAMEKQLRIRRESYA